MILLSGNSTIPLAPARFNSGISSRATCSGTMVLTATHSASERGEPGGAVFCCGAAELGKCTVGAYGFVLLGVANVAIIEKVHSKAQQCRNDNAETHECVQSSFTDDIPLAHVRVFYHTLFAIDSQKCVMAARAVACASRCMLWGETE